MPGQAFDNSHEYFYFEKMSDNNEFQTSPKK